MVFPYRPTYRVTELIAPQLGLPNGKLICEETVRIELIVTQELENVTMNAVGAGFGNRIHPSAAEFPIFRFKTLGDEAVVPHRLDSGHQACRGDAPLGAVCAPRRHSALRHTRAVEQSFVRMRYA